MLHKIERLNQDNYIDYVKEAAAKAFGTSVEAKEIKLSKEVEKSLQTILTGDFLKKFEVKSSPEKLTGLEPWDYLKNLIDEFMRHEMPIGLLPKFLQLLNYQQYVKILDDSGSMNFLSDLEVPGDSYLDDPKSKDDPSPVKKPGDKMDRWEEMREKLHNDIAILSYFPINIQLVFLNGYYGRNDTLLNHKGKTPQEFGSDAHSKLHEFFKNSASGTTPILKKLKQVFDEAAEKKERIISSLYTDGVPDEGSEAVKQLILQRKNPENCPITLVRCTSEGVEWIKETEEAVREAAKDGGGESFIADQDDYQSKLKQVRQAQGKGFYFTKGFWQGMGLVGSFSHLFDRVDDLKDPKKSLFTQEEMAEIYGLAEYPKKLYEGYLASHPSTPKSSHLGMYGSSRAQQGAGEGVGVTTTPFPMYKPFG